MDVSYGPDLNDDAIINISKNYLKGDVNTFIRKFMKDDIHCNYRALSNEEFFRGEKKRGMNIEDLFDMKLV